MSDFSRTQILLENEQRERLKQIAEQEGVTFSELVRSFLDAQLRNHAYEEMREAAELLRAEYAENQDLTSFTTLDGEDFLNE